MGRAGKALKQTLETYSISQNRLAIALGVRRSVVYHWFHEKVDPNAETVAEIVKALQNLDPIAAKAFIKLYLGDLIQKDESKEE
ncbi:MAG: helix-turn-helix domain-containing protein [Tildeniella nuda ZEHNDER 1965/U140]|jgi:predicted transcriptional regulator|nr:helix-turn-helix domain-containing protein [Tildeniella nuda ZEHNDER 1965/U140]